MSHPKLEGGWRERLRDLYAHYSPDEDGYRTSSITTGWATFTIEQKAPDIGFYLADIRSIEEFIEQVAEEVRKEERERLIGATVLVEINSHNCEGWCDDAEMKEGTAYGNIMKFISYPPTMPFTHNPDHHD